MSDFVEPSPVAITDGTNTVAIDGSGAMSVSVAGAIGGTVVVSGTVGVNNFPVTQTVAGTIGVNNFPSSQTVAGSVSVSNFPSSQTVAGTVAISGSVQTKKTFATAPVSGQQGITAGGAPLPVSNVSQGCWLSSPVANTATMYIGNQYLVGNKGLQLLPGHDVWIPISNMSLLYVQSASGTQLLNYLAL